VVADCRQALPEAVMYVYDNNSTDETSLIAQQAGAIVRKEHRQGKGNVIRRMFREIDAQCYIMLDGDDTYPAKHMQEMAEIILNGEADMVVGDRLSSTYFQENKRPFHNTGNVMVRKFINSLFGSDIRDIMTGYRAFSYEFVKTCPVMSKGFEIETEMTIHAVNHNLDIVNVEVDYRDRPENSVSKLNTFSDGIKVLRTIFSLFKNYRPFHFFSITAAVLFAISAIVFVFSVLIPYIKTGLVANFPTLIVCGFVALAALQAFFSGLMLDTEINKHNQNFEIQRLMIYDQYTRKLHGNKKVDHIE
jgi:glycosyltransferase involved in cell wall biosynthesis